MSLAYLAGGPAPATVRFLCAHGAGAGMDTPFLEAVAGLLAERGIATLRFEFAYMAARRQGGSRKPPPKAERLMDEYRAAVAAVPRRGAAADRRQVDGRARGKPRRRRAARGRDASPGWSASVIPSIRPTSPSSCARRI